jgi:hypothetical protein
LSLRARLVVALLAGAAGMPVASVGAPRAELEPQVYRLTLAADTRDHFLPAPTRSDVLFKVDARAASPKTRFMFRSPLAAGRHRLRLEVSGAGGDRTFVVAVPVAAGRSTFDVTIAGSGRYDFGFWAGDAQAPTKEYRFTLVGPAARVFAVELP